MKLAHAKVHFIGIGGIGMCGLAELLKSMGADVSGSDLSDNAQIDHLRKMNIKVHIGHDSKNIGDAEVVVYTSAVKPENPEFAEARKLKIPLIPRAEALAELMRMKRGLAIGGSHGKTTTTSMTASIFLEAKTHPTIIVGGRLELIGSTAKLGDGEWVIAEADESDGSFLRLFPEVTIITNIDNDHLDHFNTMENLRRAYFDFASRIPFYGVAILCGDDSLIRETFTDFPKRILYYGFSKDNDLIIEGSKGHYQATLHGKKLGSFDLQAAGTHNALNAAAALAAGLEAGISFDVCARGLKNFAGVDRRFEFKGKTTKGAEVFDDYGHHPTEIRAVLQAFKEKFPDRYLKVFFQPHRFSRTLLCWDQFFDAFDLADEVWLCDIYPAGEKPIAFISSEKLAGEIKHPNLKYFRDFKSRAEEIAKTLGPKDLLVTLGAGDIWKFGMQVLEYKV